MTFRASRELHMFFFKMFKSVAVVAENFDLKTVLVSQVMKRIDNYSF